MPPTMSGLGFAGRDQSGRLVRRSQAVDFSIPELDFGGGYKVFTFLLWVRPGHQPE
jgi:hypothetical protein